MKMLMLSLWAWVLAHPSETLAAVSALLYLALNVINARVPVQKRESSVWYRLLDGLAIATQKGSESKASWPVVGRSIARDAAKVVVLKPEPKDPPASPGFSEAALMRWIAGVALFVLFAAACCGCPMPAPDGCTPFATRCSPSGIPEVCSQSRRWSHAPPATACSSRGPVVCCWTRSPYGRELHACVPESACLPETGDAGVEVSDAQ